MPQFEPGLVLGALLIFIYATERFNTPRTIRASTTAGRYYSAATIYLLIYLLTFYVFSKYPHLLKVLINDADVQKQMSAMDSSNTPIFVAMIFSLLVPKVPLISELDNRLRIFLHRLASIPYEAIRMSKEVQGMRFEVPDTVTEELRREMEERNFPVQVDSVDNADPIVRNWMKIAALIIQLRHWEQANPFAPFMQERSGQLQRIHERYLRLCTAAINAYALCQQAKTQPEVPALQDAALRFCRNLRADEKSIYSEICDFVSQAILSNCYRAQTRRQALTQLGFQPKENITYEGLSIHQGVTLAGLLLMLLLTSFILFSQSVMEIELLLLRATMIVSVYSAAVFFAVYPKAQWAHFQHREGQFYPVASYVVAGVMAMAASALINLTFRTLINISDSKNEGMAMALQEAWQRFSTLAYPWLCMSFVATMVLAFLIDWTIPARLNERWQRWCKAVVLMATLMGATVLVYLWLQELYGALQKPFPIELHSLLRNSAIIGLVLGYFVPAWFRRSSQQRRTRVIESSELTPALV
ncbi:MAG: hypothetical protein HPY82_14980 [Gammaproteobacteria bacterium]|nr:hypothetical protein [Gammaproteobacteria bacterium]